MNNELTKLNIKIKNIEDKYKKSIDERRDKREKYFSALELKTSTEESKKNISATYKAYHNADNDVIAIFKELNELKNNKIILTRKIDKIEYPESALRLREKLKILKDKVNGYENHKKYIENNIENAQENYDISREKFDQSDKSDHSKYVNDLSNYSTSVSTLTKYQKEYQKLNLSFSLKPKQIDNITFQILIADRKEQLSLENRLKESTIELNNIDESIKELEKNSKTTDENELNKFKKNKELLTNKIESLNIALNNKNDVIKTNDSIKQLILKDNLENNEETKIKISILEKKSSV